MWNIAHSNPGYTKSGRELCNVQKEEEGRGEGGRQLKTYKIAVSAGRVFWTILLLRPTMGHMSAMLRDEPEWPGGSYLCALPSRRDFCGEPEKLMMNVITFVSGKNYCWEGRAWKQSPCQEDIGLVKNKPLLWDGEKVTASRGAEGEGQQTLPWVVLKKMSALDT